MDNSFAYQPATERYERMLYKYCGRSGLCRILTSTIAPDRDKWGVGGVWVD